MGKDWDNAYINGDTPWDKGAAAPPLIDFLKRQTITGRVLVPGCGQGHDVVALAEAGAVVTGMDLSPTALEAARNHFPTGARWLEGDFLKLDAGEQGVYDWVVEHTCLCALDPEQREAYARSVRAALAPEGHFLAIFFRVVSNYDGSGPPHPITSASIDSLFKGDFECLDAYTPEVTYPCRPVGREEVRLYRKL
jgi:SAM-dependent methyltransferase